MLNSLQHGNIVKCYGVAIMPPAISLVSEYCTYGSLFDFLHSTDLILNDTLNRTSTTNRTGAARIRTETGETIESTGSERKIYAQSTSKLFKWTTEVIERESVESSHPSSQVGDLESGYSSNDDGGLEGSSAKIVSNPMISKQSQITLANPRNRSTELVKEVRKSVDLQNGDLYRGEMLKYLDPESTGNVESSDVASRLADAMGSGGPYSLASSYHVSSELLMSGASKRSNTANAVIDILYAFFLIT